MAINFPNIVPNSLNFGIKYNTQISVSPLSGSVQTVEIPGARWTAELTFSGLEAYEGRVLAAFIAEMRGSSGRFFLHDFSHAAPRGTASAPGAVTISGAGQTGNSVTTAGWNISQTGVLLPGDYVSFDNNELKLVTQQVDTDISGNATITFDPPLRNPPSDASSVTLTECKTIMMLNNDENFWGATTSGLLTDISISCIEAFV